MRHFTMLTLFLCLFGGLQAQHMTVEGGFVKMTGGNLVLQDMNFNNNGAFLAIDGNVTMSGTTTTLISGSNTPLFDTLTIAKSSGDVELEQDIWIGGALELQGGMVYVQDADLQILDPGTINGAGSSQYIVTNGNGTLTQAVADAASTYPIGNSSYNPVILDNTGGTADYYSVRVDDAVLTNGASGSAITTYVVDRTWHVEEATPGNSNLDVTVFWDDSEELGFTSGDYVLANYNSGWSAQVTGTPGSSMGLNNLTLTNTDLTGEFAVFEDRNGYAVPYDCLADDLTLTTDISGKDDIHAADFIEASNVIESSGDVIYTAGESITLQAGFEAQAGAYFHAFIFSCSFSSVQAIESREEIEELTKPEAIGKLQVELFPNPFRESTNIKFFIPKADDVQLFITDLNGKIIHQDSKVNVLEGWQNTTFEPGNLPSGMYMLVVKTNNQTVTKQMVVERN